jgi:gliding motility-associated-like protein
MTRQDAYSFKEKFYKARTIKIDFLATDQNGCVFKDNVNSSIDETALPVIEKLDTVCSGSNSTIRIRNTNKSPEGLTRRVFDYGVDYLGNRVVFAPYVSSTGIETVIYKFPDVGQLPFKVYGIVLGNDTSLIDGRQNECRAVLDTSIFVRPIPQIKFTANPVCARNDTTFFKNLTRFRHNSTDPKDSIIVSYLWDFGDGSSRSNLKNPSHVFQIDGNKMVSLTATTASGCKATDTLEVGVKSSPKAYFTTSKDSSLLDFSEPIEFINLTTGEYTKALWEFGDGDISSDLFNTQHQYDSLKRFEVKLTVWNNQNECPDSYTKVAELRPILLLPNVFSPNGDGQNDQLFLIYRLIDELEEFKIYNRWGQVVFDANGNLKARWDGTYKGTDQEIGSYVAYVKAKGKHGINYNFKQNITLIR